MTPDTDPPVAAALPGSGKSVHFTPSEIDFSPPLLESLATLFRLKGRHISLNMLRAGLPVQDGPVTMQSIARTALQAGMTTRVVRKPGLANISPLTLPCILVLKENRSCVLTRIEPEGKPPSASVIFPETGPDPVCVEPDQLASEFLGYAIFGRFDSSLDKRASDIRLVESRQWFWGTILHFLPIYRHVVVASLVINLLTIASPLFVMNVYDRVVPNNALDTLWVLAIGIGLAYLFDFLLRNLRSYFVDIAGKNADVIIASRLMQQLLTMKLDFKPDSTGTLANNIREFESLREFFGSTTLLALIDLPFLFLFILLVSFIGGPIAQVPLLAVPAVLLFGFLLQFPFQRVVESGYRESAQKNALLVEIINGLETVKTSQAEGRMQALWEQVVGMSARSNSRAKNLANLSITLSLMAAQIVSVVVIIWGVHRIGAGEMTMGGLIACNILAGRAMAPLSQVAAMLARLQQSRMALKSLDLLMNLPSETKDAHTHFDYSGIEGTLQVEDLVFSYPGAERDALRNVQLSISHGEKIGVIGKMGSGKSTLGRLMVGLFDPKEGAVKLGGVDIRQLDVADLRSRIGYVSQDNYLFYGSVRDNIALGTPDADDRMLLRAADIAGVTDFIKNHPAGFGMPVGERGMALSGGQRQAVAIARALLHDPGILILDEPTSNMDNASEARMKARIRQACQEKTLILVTHRMTMLDLVDRLLVVDGGRIVADGPRDRVLESLRKDRVPTGAAVARTEARSGRET